MNKNQLLDEIKIDLSAIVSNLSFENFNQSELYFKKYLEILSALSQLPDDFSTTKPLEVPITNKINEIYDVKNNIFLGQVHLNLSGANIGSFKIFIPEKYIRKLNIEEGDWVKASVVKNSYDYHPVYEYELIKKVSGSSNKSTIKYAIVENDDSLNQLYILSNPSDKLSHKILLDQHKLGNFMLKIGDVVDYAYWNDDFLTGKVVWIYPTDEENCAYESNSEELSKSDKLKNKTICIIGLDEKKSLFSKIINENGGNFLHLLGTETVEELSSEISKSNIIIIFIDSVGHDGMFKIRNVSKQFEIPILYSKEINSNELLNMVCEELNI